MHRGNHTDKRRLRHARPYERINLPDNMRKDLAKYVVNSSPLRGGQSSRRVEKSQVSQSSPVKIKKEPSESGSQIEIIDDTTSNGQLSSSDGDDEMILAASRKLAHDTVPDQRKGVGISPAARLHRPPIGQEIPEQEPTAMATDKGKLSAGQAAARYGYPGVLPPSSLSAGPSSATWASRQSGDFSHSINIQSVDLERFSVEMNNLIDEFCVHAKMKVEEFANRGR